MSCTDGDFQPEIKVSASGVARSFGMQQRAQRVDFGDWRLTSKFFANISRRASVDWHHPRQPGSTFCQPGLAGTAVGGEKAASMTQSFMQHPCQRAEVLCLRVTGEDD